MFHGSWNQLQIFEKVMLDSHAGEVLWVENVLSILKMLNQSNIWSIAKLAFKYYESFIGLLIRLCFKESTWDIWKTNVWLSCGQGFLGRECYEHIEKLNWLNIFKCCKIQHCKKIIIIKIHGNRECFNTT